jgi:type VI secretion system Hcp family effector
MQDTQLVTPERRRLRLTVTAALVAAALVAGVIVASTSNHRAGAATVAPHVLANTNQTLSITGVTGYPATIPILSFSWGATVPVSVSTGLVTGKVHYQEFTITKKIDITSPKLFLSMSQNQNLPGVNLLVASGGVTVSNDKYQLKFLNAHIISIQIGGASGDSPTESVSFNFTKVQMVYTAGLIG